MERVAAVVAAVLALTVVGFGGWLLLGRDQVDPREQAGQVVEGWAQALERERFDDLRALASGPVDVEAYRTMWDTIGITDVEVTAELGAVDRASADATLDVTATLGELGSFDYTVDLRLVEPTEGWRVDWQPSTLHPDYQQGWTWSVEVEDVQRAAILDRDGAPLTEPGEIAVVGIHPARVTDPDQVASVLGQHTDAEQEKVNQLLARDDLQPDWFYPVVDVRDAQRAAELRSIFADVPGIVFRSKAARLTPSDGFASHVLGRTGEITAELLEEWGPPYQVGDTVGLSGLERAYERQLAGRPATTVHLVDEAGNRRAQVASFAGVAPEPVHTTLDRAVQAAAEDAMGPIEGGALVAIDVPSGHVLAAVSRPLDGFDRAMTGLYAPGSTFKIVTAAAFLEQGNDAATPVDCPAELVVGGLRVTNLDGFDLGTAPLRQAFARSCNTTFASIAADLPEGRLGEVAERFGFGVAYDVGVPAAGGRFPSPQDLAERAAAGFGQARVQASPLHLASVAAAVADGTWRAPRLLVDGADGPTRTLPSQTAGALRLLMQAAVAEGTGQAAALPGEPPVHGKTGSAETGDADVTHAWFVAFRGDVAVAVLVEGGGSGGQVAAPIAADFLAALN